MAVIIHRKQQRSKVKCIPLSANTVRKHIKNIAEGLKKQVSVQFTQWKRIPEWMGESTNVSKMPQIMVFEKFQQ